MDRKNNLAMLAEVCKQFQRPPELTKIVEGNKFYSLNDIDHKWANILEMREDNIEKVKEIIYQGFNVNTIYCIDSYVSPLILAIQSALYDIADYLLSQGADYMHIDTTGFTPVPFIYKEDDVLKIKRTDPFLSKFAKSFLYDDDSSCTRAFQDDTNNTIPKEEFYNDAYLAEAMFYGAAYNDIASIRESLQYGGYVEVKNECGVTPIMLAKYYLYYNFYSSYCIFSISITT